MSTALRRQVEDTDRLTPLSLAFCANSCRQADSSVCYDLEEVMCEREWNVLS